MATVGEILHRLEAIAPARYAFDFDRVGLQVGSERSEVSKALVSLDRSIAAVEACAAVGAQLLVSHHPLIFQPLGEVTDRTHVGRTALLMASHGISFIAAHTNWDCARGGINDVLARRLGLQDVQAFGAGANVEQLKMVVTCPPEAVDAVREAAARAGAGRIGSYDFCSFQSDGVGTFLPREGSRPTIGTVGSLEAVPEIRLEMVLLESVKSAVDAAVRAVHPYEVPAIDYFVLPPGPEQAAGRIGTVPPTSLRNFSASVGIELGTSTWTWGNGDREIRRVAVVGGAADGEWRAAQLAGADVLVTGEVKQHLALEAMESGFALIAAGHYATEQPGCEALAERLRAEVPDVEWICFEPEPGSGGRPLST